MSIQNPAAPTLANGSSVARDILNRHADADGKVPFPVDPVGIAAAYGITTSTAVLPLATAGIALREKTGEPFRIFLNQADRQEDQRVTAARLLARIYPVLDLDGAAGFIEPYEQTDQIASDFVDAFAAEFVAPAYVVRLWWSQGKSIKKIARRFGLTRATTLTRLRSLGLAG